MVKRLAFVNRRPGLSAEEFASGWPDALRRWSAAPPEARPARVAACTVVDDDGGIERREARHDGLELVWCSDLRHLERCAAWWSSVAAETAEAWIEPGPTRVVVADELVVRGAGWLEGRWRHAGVAFKHVAIAHRAGGLTPQEFSDRWRRHAGQVAGAGAGPAIAIPDEVRGLAYVQNHPRVDVEVQSAYDAVNEVYFDDLAGVRHRMAWFAANLAGGQPDLVGEHWFLAFREVVVPCGPHISSHLGRSW